MPARKSGGLWFKSWWQEDIFPFVYLVVSLTYGRVSIVVLSGIDILQMVQYLICNIVV